jgi:hypothetical protein
LFGGDSLGCNRFDKLGHGGGDLLGSDGGDRLKILKSIGGGQLGYEDATDPDGVAVISSAAMAEIHSEVPVETVIDLDRKATMYSDVTAATVSDHRVGCGNEGGAGGMSVGGQDRLSLTQGGLARLWGRLYWL